MKIIDFKRITVRWAEIPAWLAVVVGLSGILLTYWEIRSAHEREIIFRAWDDAQELFRSSLDFPGDSSKDRVAIEVRLMGNIGAHAGLIADRTLIKKHYAVGHAWSVAHLRAKRGEVEKGTARTELTTEVGELIDELAKELGTFDPDSPFHETFSMDEL